MHLDNAVSYQYDDSNDDLLIRIRIDAAAAPPPPTPSSAAANPIPSSASGQGAQTPNKKGAKVPAALAQRGCSAYFGVLQDDPKAPGRYVARMTKSQDDWYEKKGKKQYPGLCYSLDKARYLIVWTVSTEASTVYETVNRTAQANTSTTGTQSGTFNTYGNLSTLGNYSGTSSSSSTTTITIPERVPVTLTADHCYVYVLKSVGSTIWDDVRNKTPQPLTFFSTETRGANRVNYTEESDNPGTTVGRALGSALARAMVGDPTMHALEASLKFISAHSEDAIPPQQLSSPQGMRNADVVQLKGAGLGDQVIMDAINSAASVQFELDAPHLVELHNAGLSDAVIQAMLGRSKSK